MAKEPVRLPDAEAKVLAEQEQGDGPVEGLRQERSVGPITTDEAPTADELSAPPPSSSNGNAGLLVELPTKGLLYGDSLPGGTVEVIPITFKAEKRLAGGGGNMASIMDTLLRTCVQTDALSLDDWITTDAFYLLLRLRGHTYPSDMFPYHFPVQCDACGATFQHECHIPDDFDIRWLEDDAEEPFFIDLPDSGVTISTRLLRRKDEKQIAKYAARAGRRRRGVDIEGDGEDMSYAYRMATRITEVDGDKLPLEKRLVWLDTLSAIDTLEIKDYFEENDPGMDTTMWIDCTSCGYENEETLPLTGEFFRPRRNRK